jgi:PhzF family phenazine biosynthesis protein
MVELHFVTLDVFTTERFRGNPLAIVYVPPKAELSQDRKQTIAKEFNLSETVFLHLSVPDTSNVDGKDVSVDIFTVDQELPFAGHPTIGTTYHLLSKTGKSSKINLITKAGRIPARFDPDADRARLEVPHAIAIHDVSVPVAKVSQALGLLPSFPSNFIIPNDLKGVGVALVSIVKGLAFILLRVASLHVLATLKSTGFKFKAEDVGATDLAADTFIATYAYYIKEESATTTKIRTRMFDGNLEDPATGSAASCLCGYLSIVAASSDRSASAQAPLREYEVTQGVEMGRQSDISVDVQLTTVKGKEGASVDKIWLGGSAVEVMHGTIVV